MLCAPLQSQFHWKAYMMLQLLASCWVFSLLSYFIYQYFLWNIFRPKFLPLDFVSWFQLFLVGVSQQAWTPSLYKHHQIRSFLKWPLLMFSTTFGVKSAHVTHSILPQTETINFLRLLVSRKPVTPIKSFDKISDTFIPLTTSRIYKVLNSFQVCWQKKKVHLHK